MRMGIEALLGGGAELGGPDTFGGDTEVLNESLDLLR